MVHNSNLLFHGCIPVSEDGNLKEILIGDKLYSGENFYKEAENMVREGYFDNDLDCKLKGMDLMWYL